MKATTVNQSAAERNITLVALANIQPSSFNPRKHFDEANLYELAESIKQQGVLQPITVRPIAETDRYEIVFGERRYRASVMVEMEDIPAIVSELTDEAAEEMAITENLQRKDVTPIEEANAYQKLIENGRHTVQTLAVLFGKNENYIRTRLKFPNSRNRHPFGNGRTDYQRGDRDLPIRRGHTKRSVRETFAGRHRIQQLEGTESCRCCQTDREQLYHRFTVLLL